LEAVLAIDESQMEFVRPGQAAEILLEQFPAATLRTEIKETSTQDNRSAGQGPAAQRGSGLPTRADSGREQPLASTYQASCYFEDQAGRIVAGGTGQARIFTGYQTLAQRIGRYVARTFSLRSYHTAPL